MRLNLTSKLKVLNNSVVALSSLFRTLEKMGLRKKVGVGEYQDYSSTSEEEDLLLSKPWSWEPIRVQITVQDLTLTCLIASVISRQKSPRLWKTWIWICHRQSPAIELLNTSFVNNDSRESQHVKVKVLFRAIYNGDTARVMNQLKTFWN